jgi:hypothetical protein
MSTPAASADSAQTVIGTVNGATATQSGTVAGPGASTVKSDWVAISGARGVAFDVAWSGGSNAPAGLFTVEGTNLDAPPLAATACPLIPMAAVPAVLTGNSGVASVETIQSSFRWARLVSTQTAGTFTLAALAFAKRIPT